MNIGECDPGAGWRIASDEIENCRDGSVVQVIGHAFPKEQSLEPARIADLTQAISEAFGEQVCLHTLEISSPLTFTVEQPVLVGYHLGPVYFDERDIRKRGQAQRPTVEARSEY